MKALVVYDSTYGNTEKIAKAIGAALEGDVKVQKAGEVNVAELSSYDLLVIGSPTYGGRPMPTVADFMNKIPDGAVKGKKAAAFDTRIPTKFAKLFGYAADRIAKSLKDNGANMAATAEGFFVNGKSGPLKDGEEARATVWAKGLGK
jgi:flavodoxin I